MDSNIPYINLDNLTFKTIKSVSSGYGVIWTGTYLGNPCAIKMLILTTGSYYDKDKGIFIGQEGCEKVFDKNDKIPFYHSLFKRKRSMTRTQLRHEIFNQQILSNLLMSPKIFTYGKSHHINGIQYGFIVMELLYGSLREFLKTRKLYDNEKELILKLFIKLHEENNMVHGDLKPANIGVRVDLKGNIKEFMFFDCSTIKYKSDMEEEEFIRRVKNDIKYFKTTSKFIY